MEDGALKRDIQRIELVRVTCHALSEMTDVQNFDVMVRVSGFKIY
jgi:hypothetical protein